MHTIQFDLRHALCLLVLVKVQEIGEAVLSMSHPSVNKAKLLCKPGKLHEILLLQQKQVGFKVLALLFQVPHPHICTAKYN